LLYFVWLELLDVVEDEVVEEDVVGLFLTADFGAALGALIEVEKVL
jgi:hypothetical protein